MSKFKNFEHFRLFFDNLAILIAQKLKTLSGIKGTFWHDLLLLKVVVEQS